jgi:ornithine decarboxylase
MLSRWRPVEPVYCVYPSVLRREASRFVDGFPGEVLYAVKANPAPLVLQELAAGGITDFDTASVPEMELVRRTVPSGRCHFMAPVKLPGAALTAYQDFGVRSFVVDHRNELERLLLELPRRDVEIFVRLAAHDADATYDLSTKFGASPEEAIDLLARVAAAGTLPSLAFNVGSLVLRPGAYRRALEQCRHLMAKTTVGVARVDVGGGFPAWYPDVTASPMKEFFNTMAQFAGGEAGGLRLIAEPGRALVAEGVSLVAQVLLRKDDRLYLNDGVWGSFIEPVISKGLVRYPTRSYRDAEPMSADTVRDFTLFGPTCDSLDVLPRPFPLPADIQRGDWIEFGNMGAYSLTNRTGFNGFYPDRFARIEGDQAVPPAPVTL